MPRGSYLVAGRTEAFSCAPGPAGWRYVSDVLDVACQADFTVVRFEVRSAPEADGTGRTWARGGRTSLDDGERLLTWVCSAAPELERVSAAQRVDGPSPGLLVALVRSVAAPGSGPVRRAVPVVRFDEPALAGLDARRVLSRVSAGTHTAPQGDLLVEHWYLDDPDTGLRVSAHVAGDVVLAAEGGGVDIVLDSLESPPTGAGRG